MSTYGNRKAFGEQVISDPHGAGYTPADNYGFDPGLTIKQHVYIQMCAALVASGRNITPETVYDMAVVMTHDICVRLEKMA